MLNPSDLIHLPYTPSLTEGGITFACRTLATASTRLDSPPYEWLRGQVAGAALELAFRRHLSAQSIPFKVQGVTPFTQPERYDLLLGGHRSALHGVLISRRRQIASIRHDPGSLLQAPALVPLEAFAADENRPDDLLLFAFCLGLTTPTRMEVTRALEAGQPAWFIHPLPREWARPVNWFPLAGLTIKSECDAPLAVEIGGLDEAHSFVTASLVLRPGSPTPVEQIFYSLAYVHVGQRPDRRVALHCSRRGEAHMIQPNDWGNIWVYGMDITLAGWLTRQDFRRKASLLDPGSGAFQYEHTGGKNLQVPVAGLEPFEGLFEKIRSWERSRRR